MFRAGGARDAKCLEVHGTVPNNEEWRHQLPAAPLLRNSEAPFTCWNKPFQNAPSGYMFFICNFLKCSHLQATFCLHFFFTAMAISAGYLPFVPEICSPPSVTHTYTVSRASLWCPTGFIQKWHPQEAIGWEESRVWVFIPQDSSLVGISRVHVSSMEGGLSGSPLHTAISSGSDNCTLPRAYCCQVLRYHLGLPTPCFINNTFIKLHSGHRVWMCPASCWDLINYLSSSMINFL